MLRGRINAGGTSSNKQDEPLPSGAEAQGPEVSTVERKQTDRQRTEDMKKLLLIALATFVAGAVSVRAADVKAIWDKECAKCHGAEGKGDTKMGQKLKAKDYTDAKVQAEMKDADMVKAIKDGVKEKDTGKTLMKAFPDLTDDEVKALVKHIRAMKK